MTLSSGAKRPLMSRTISVNTIAFFNENIPLRRHLHPQEVASSVLHLACGASSFTTGGLPMANGGLST